MKQLVWLSANIFGYELLKEVSKSISAVITLSANSKTIQYDDVQPSEWYKLKTPVYPIEDINKEADLLRDLKPDVVIMCGWRQVLSKEILDIPKEGVIAFHPTLLPKGRGSAPIINAILEGLEVSGVTAYYAKDGIDNGDIIEQVSFPINDTDYAMDLYNKVIESGKAIIRDLVTGLLKGKTLGIPQDETVATYFPARSLRDNEIFEYDSIEMASRKIRAFSKPYRGAFIKQGDRKVIVWNGEVK